MLIVPRRSDVVPHEVSPTTKLSRNIALNIPIVSAAMDTVTDARLAIALAQEGGIGIIHRNFSIQRQADEVRKVKRSEAGVITSPITLKPDATIEQARTLMNTHNISGMPVMADDKVIGIITRRDLRFHKDGSTRVDEVMTTRLVTAAPDTTIEQAKDLLHKNKIEKLLLVDKQMHLKGLITIKDINKIAQYPSACKDELGRLRCGAAVDTHDYERIEALIEAGVDVVVVDKAHGHSSLVIDTVAEVKKRFDIECIAGNVVTADATKALIDAGVDAVKVGVGPSAICTTRVIAGVGVPQVTAIMNAVSAAEDAGVPVIADGGIRYSGDVAKAIAAGAHCVMIGTLLAGNRRKPRRGDPLSGPYLQDLSRHGFAGRDGRGQQVALFPGQRGSQGKTGARGYRGTDPIQGPAREVHLPDGRRASCDDGLHRRAHD